MKEHVKKSQKEGRVNQNVGHQQDAGKKPFDKKKYRLQKYSNTYKIKQWEDRRKKAVLRDYYKELDKDEREKQKKQINQEVSNPPENPSEQSKKISAFTKAKQEFLRKKDEKRKKKEEALQIKAEKEEAIKKYKEKKTQAYKKLSKKTKKGQPVMKDRLEMLLEKIQNNVAS